MKKNKVRIIQILPTLSYGDGVSNDTLAIDRILRKNGFRTKIYAENIDKRIPKETVQHIARLPRLKERDIILYHLSTGSRLNDLLPGFKGRKIIIYHNITPDKYFADYHDFSATLCREGRKSLSKLCTVPEYCLADSPYNREELLENGYSCKIDVMPIIIPFEDYEKTPSGKVMSGYENDGYTNIIFTGRIAPNKKQEDIIEVFAYYQKYYNQKSRLFLVGSYHNMEKYLRRLQGYVQQLGVKHVVFTGHIPFDEILAYYHLADLFLCMSEHEGFCIPLVEAMYFQIPVIARAGTGVTGTLGDGGILLEGKNPLETAGLIHYVLEHPRVREALTESGSRRLEDFATERMEQLFMNYLNAFMA